MAEITNDNAQFAPVTSISSLMPAQSQAFTYCRNSLVQWHVLIAKQVSTIL